MNNINSTFTSVFLDALAKDKSTVKSMSPIVVFRRILGLGERVDTSEVMKSLQRHATLMGKLKEFSSNVISNKFTGEVISFDIGPDPSWAQFKVIREPIPEGKGTVINFVFVVTDQKNLKRWTRLVGTIANELKDGKNVPVFRLIQDMCIEEDLPKPVKEEDLKPINQEQPPMPEPGDAPAEEQQENEPPKNLVFHKGDIVTTISKDGDATIFVEDEEGQKVDVWSFKDPENKVASAATYVAIDDVFECSTESMLDTFLEKFERVQRAENTTQENPVEKQKPDTPAAKEVQNERVLLMSTRVKFDISDEGVVRILSVPEKDGEEAAVLHEFTDIEFKNFVNPEKIYIVDYDLWNDSFDAPASEIAEAFKEEAFEMSDAEPDAEKPASVVADIDHQAEVKEPVVVIKKGELVTLDEYPGKEFVCLTKDLTDVEVAEATKNGTLFDLLMEVKEKDSPIQESLTKGNIMEEIVIYNEGDEAEFPQAPGKKFKANRKITQEMVVNNKGIMPTEWFDEIKTEVAVPQTNMKPIGEEPNTKKCSEEHTQSEYMNMLFGTPNPSILHVVNMLKKCAGGDEYELTGTDTIERMIAFEDYTFSIVKMKNGAYYRVWVAHTDMERGTEGSWLNTHNEPDRWFKIGDIQDREMSRLLNSRR